MGTLNPIDLKKDYKNRDFLDYNRWNADQTAIQNVVNKFISSIIDGDSGADNLSMTAIEDISTETKVQAFLESLVTLLLSQAATDYGKFGLTKVLAKYDGTGGSSIIGSQQSGGLVGTTVFDQLKNLRTAIDQIVAGQIPVGSIDNAKLAADIKVGSLAELTTTAKAAIVAAINEVNGKAGTLDNLTTLNKTSLVGAVNEIDNAVKTHLAEDATDAHNAGNISANVIGVTGDDVQEILTNLFQFANDGKTGEANVIGAPALATDSFATLNGYIQTHKNTLATNLTAKGQSSLGTETLAALVAKVANIITGKRFASGVVVSTSTNETFTGQQFPSVTVSGLTFKPSIIIIYNKDSGYGGVTLYNADAPYYIIQLAYEGVGERHVSLTSPASVTTTGFKLPVYWTNKNYHWIAIE